MSVSRVIPILPQVVNGCVHTGHSRKHWLVTTPLLSSRNAERKQVLNSKASLWTDVFHAPNIQSPPSARYCRRTRQDSETEGRGHIRGVLPIWRPSAAHALAKFPSFELVSLGEQNTFATRSSPVALQWKPIHAQQQTDKLWVRRNPNGTGKT